MGTIYLQKLQNALTTCMYKFTQLLHVQFTIILHVKFSQINKFRYSQYCEDQKVQVGKDQERRNQKEILTPKTEVGKNQNNNQALIP